MCLAVFVELPRYEERGRPFMAFVHGIAPNVLSEVFRRRARSPAIDRAALDADEHEALIHETRLCANSSADPSQLSCRSMRPTSCAAHSGFSQPARRTSWSCDWASATQRAGGMPSRHDRGLGSPCPHRAMIRLQQEVISGSSSNPIRPLASPICKAS